jgi:hypothetical protein
MPIDCTKVVIIKMSCTIHIIPALVEAQTCEDTYKQVQLTETSLPTRNFATSYSSFHRMHIVKAKGVVMFVSGTRFILETDQ